jgi:Pyruvate kinase, barrel domain
MKSGPYLTAKHRIHIPAMRTFAPLLQPGIAFCHLLSSQTVTGYSRILLACRIGNGVLVPVLKRVRGPARLSLGIPILPPPGLVNYDDILKETDGIMAARGDLAMEIPSEKVCLDLPMEIDSSLVPGMGFHPTALCRIQVSQCACLI